MHRDLKSKNVLLTAPPPSGTAKLCDFGLARMRMESATMTGKTGLTSTYKFLAPSQLLYAVPTTIYSTACEKRLCSVNFLTRRFPDQH